MVAFGKLGIFSVGVDMSPHLVAAGNNEIRKNNLLSKAYLVIGNAVAIPMSPGIFDCVTILGNTFSLLEREEGRLLLAEAKRLLCSNGVVIMDIPAAHHAVASLPPGRCETCRKIKTESLGEVEVIWIRELDLGSKSIRSRETYTFLDGKARKQVKSVTFAFRLYDPEEIMVMASQMGLQAARLMEYTDDSGRYVGMLRRRLFLILKRQT